jgi:hypothetical protein
MRIIVRLARQNGEIVTGVGCGERSSSICDVARPMKPVENREFIAQP